ncbi:unnamed protein product [Ranitomeya imitator]|uniref:DUF4614 domain-containing protein n=1 Tax=Ranitomeya imitator TaxID=111125 RepID=A0ABN9KU53_9NEOB|nr:unnamed protein product [Ranitomeya imitator]
MKVGANPTHDAYVASWKDRVPADPHVNSLCGFRSVLHLFLNRNPQVKSAQKTLEICGKSAVWFYFEIENCCHYYSNLQEYMLALNRKTSALKLSQPSDADMSDMSAEEQESEKYRASASPQQVSGTQSRFLKKKTPSRNDIKSNAVVTIEAKKPADLQPVQSKMPTSAALRRLAEIESRHRLRQGCFVQHFDISRLYFYRKLEIDISENDSEIRTSEERPFSNRSSSEFSSREKTFLKKKVNITEPKPVRQNNRHGVRNKPVDSKPGALESEEEEMLHLVGSSVEFSENEERWWKLPKPPRTPSPPSKSTPRRKLRHSPSTMAFVSPRRAPSRLNSRTPSPPSYGSPRFQRRSHSLTRFRSRSPSPSVRSSMNSPSPRTRLGRLSRTPVSQRSDIKSLEELFSRPEDDGSASSNDFKLNILSLDDLVLPIDAEETKVKIISEKPVDFLHPSPAHDKGHSLRRDVKSFTRRSISEGESVTESNSETNKDSEILSQRHRDDSSSSDHYNAETADESTVNSVYSEDFEDSVLTETEHSSKSDSYSNSKSLSANKSVLLPHHSYAPSNKTRKKMAENIQRVTVKEIAVQTSDAGFLYQWPHSTPCYIGGLSTALQNAVDKPLMTAISFLRQSSVIIPIPLQALQKRCSVQDSHFQFTALPFGLAITSRVSKKIIVAVMAIRQSGVILVIPCLDNFLFKAQSYPSVRVCKSISLLGQDGFFSGSTHPLFPTVRPGVWFVTQLLRSAHQCLGRCELRQEKSEVAVGLGSDLGYKGLMD